MVGGKESKLQHAWDSACYLAFSYTIAWLHAGIEALLTAQRDALFWGEAYIYHGPLTNLELRIHALGISRLCVCFVYCLCCRGPTVGLIRNSICDFGWKAHDFGRKGIEGKTYALANVRGPKRTLIVFVCNHCPYVKASITITKMPNDTDTYHEDSCDNMKEFAAMHGFTSPALSTRRRTWREPIALNACPTSFGFNAQDEPQHRWRLDASRIQPAAHVRHDLFEARSR
jgi:hypothetical protein